MSTDEIEDAITRLSPREVEDLMAWLEDYRARMWDEQIEEDLKKGRFDDLLAEVGEEYEAGQAEPLCGTGP